MFEDRLPKKTPTGAWILYTRGGMVSAKMCPVANLQYWYRMGFLPYDPNAIESEPAKESTTEPATELQPVTVKRRGRK